MNFKWFHCHLFKTETGHTSLPASSLLLSFCIWTFEKHLSLQCFLSNYSFHIRRGCSAFSFYFSFLPFFQNILSVLPLSHLSLICPKCSWTVIVTYLPPPSPPCRNNQQLCSKIVLLWVQISSRVKQRKNKYFSSQG